jgi:hypothetical protein
MNQIPTILISGSNAPLFTAVLMSSLSVGSSLVSLVAVGFDTERLFMRARSEIATRGACSLSSSDCVQCEWELRTSKSVLARVRITDANAVEGLAVSVPGDYALEGKLQRLLRNAYDPLARNIDGSFSVSPLYAQYSREVFADCFHVTVLNEDVQQVACNFEGSAKVCFGAKFCLFMIIFFVPLLFFLGKILITGLIF